MSKRRANDILRICLAVIFACAAAVFGAESPQDIMAGVVADEVARYLDERVDVREAGGYSIVVHSFGDETGELATEAMLIKKLLYGKFSFDSRFVTIDQSKTKQAADMLLEGRPTEAASEETLKELGSELGSRYLVAGRLFRTGADTLLQVYLFDLWEGILLCTPIFDVPVAKAEKIEVPEPEKLVPAFAPEGGLRFFEGEAPPSPVLGFEVYRDDDGALAAAFLTTTSFEVYRILPENALKSVWTGEYKKAFPRRGTAASLHIVSSASGQATIVSMNPFKYSFRYEWSGDKFEKARNIDGFVVDALEGVELISKYGRGVVSFEGVSTFLRVTDGTGEVKKHALPLAVDYFGGCILEWDSTSLDLVRVAVVDETGVIRIYGAGGKEIMATEEKYGGGLDCGRRGKERYLAATTVSPERDAVLLLSQEENGIKEVWRSKTVDGAIYSQKFVDINGDGDPEIAGVLEEKGGRQRLFAVAPSYPAGPPAQSGEPKKLEAGSDVESKEAAREETEEVEEGTSSPDYNRE
ncbi:MAG: hypothetical protein ABIH66_04030 [bacterium]